MVFNKKIMQTENDFLHEIAEIILSIFKDPAIGLTKETVCRDGHFSPKMLTADKLLHMQCTHAMLHDAAPIAVSVHGVERQ